MKAYSFFIFLLLGMLVFNVNAELSEEGFFSGRISRINDTVNLVRIKVSFENLKYLNPKDKIEFWDERNKTLKCKAYVVGRSSDYLLLKIPELPTCEKKLFFTLGAYFKFYSEDLLNNIKMGKEVVGILLKKRMAVSAQLDFKNKEISAHIERVGAVSSRYQMLRTKLDEEWQKELHALEEDKVFALRSLKSLEQRRDEIDQKLELYKLKDENLTLDRWSLDSRLYFKK